ncbi:hypothetical protein GCM10023096_08440 [Nonomuraea ferruginea]
MLGPRPLTFSLAMMARARSLSWREVMGARPGRVPLVLPSGLAAVAGAVVSVLLARATTMTAPAKMATASLRLKQGSVVLRRTSLERFPRRRVPTR